jgi:hypothetical protein
MQNVGKIGILCQQLRRRSLLFPPQGVLMGSQPPGEGDSNEEASDRQCFGHWDRLFRLRGRSQAGLQVPPASSSAAAELYRLLC